MYVRKEMPRSTGAAAYGTEVEPIEPIGLEKESSSKQQIQLCLKIFLIHFFSILLGVCGHSSFWNSWSVLFRTNCKLSRK